MFRSAASVGRATLAAYLNEDPKTSEMKTDAYVAFGEDTAQWKAELLRCHRSQQERNLRTRGYGLDERILGMNRRAAERCAVGRPYAEVFQIEVWADGEHTSRAPVR